MKEELSKAIILYLGFGANQFPVRNLDILYNEFHPNLALALEAQIQELIDENSQVAQAIDWSKYNPETGPVFMRDNIKRRHPELTDEAAEALAWRHSFEWDY